MIKSTILLALLSTLALAAPTPGVIPHNEIVANSAKGLRLLSLEDGKKPVWRTEAQALDLLRQHKHFFDVTETYEDEIKSGAAPSLTGPVIQATFPSGPTHQTAVNALIAKMSVDNMLADLTKLTSFNNRYYKSTTGVDSQKWITSTLQGIAGSRTDITITEFTHTWSQKSIIARINGVNNTAPITMMGCHQDSINLSSPTNGRAPGADDNGSGCVAMIEIFREMVATGYQPATPLEIHWYSGEEAGLLGSQAVASKYKSSGKVVKSYLNLDMIAYLKPGTTEGIYLETDYTDVGLNTFIKTLASTYTTIPTINDQCGYACSDHASWNKQGVPAVMPFESLLGNDNPDIHGNKDTINHDYWYWAHAMLFVRLATAYAVELTSA
jgi:leucyl aminopeptidase